MLLMSEAFKCCIIAIVNDIHPVDTRNTSFICKVTV